MSPVAFAYLISHPLCFTEVSRGNEWTRPAALINQRAPQTGRDHHQKLQALLTKPPRPLLQPPNHSQLVVISLSGAHS